MSLSNLLKSFSSSRTRKSTGLIRAVARQSAAGIYAAQNPAQQAVPARARFEALEPRILFGYYPAYDISGDPMPLSPDATCPVGNGPGGSGDAGESTSSSGGGSGSGLTADSEYASPTSGSGGTVVSGSISSSDSNGGSTGTSMAPIPTQNAIVGKRTAGGGGSSSQGAPALTGASTSNEPVRSYDGTPQINSTDLLSNGFGAPWGVVRTWTGLNSYSLFGNGWSVAGVPYLTVAGNTSSDQRIAVVDGGVSSFSFSFSNTSPYASFAPWGAYTGTLAVISGSPNFLRFTDTQGNTTDFYDVYRVSGKPTPWASYSLSSKYGLFKSYTTANGSTTLSATYDGSGYLQSLTRSDASSGDSERLVYTYATVTNSEVTSHSATPPTLTSTVTLQRLIGGTWQSEQRAIYTYCTGETSPGTADPNGRLGDLKLVQIQDFGPVATTGAVASGGSVPVGSVYYQVTAVLPQGESSPSAEIAVTTTSGNRTVNLSWSAVANATSYKIYASTAAGGELYLGSTSSTSYSDTSGSSSGAQPPVVNTLSSSGHNGSSLDTVSTLNTTLSANKSQSFTLDALGNQTSVTTDGTAVGRTVNSQNELTALGGTSLAFDNNGNTTTDDQGHTLVYDAWNQLVAVKNGGTTLVTYAFDANAEQISRTASGTTTNLYLSSDGQVLEERQSSSVTNQYVWGLAYVNDLVLRDDDSTSGSYGKSSSGLGRRVFFQQDANYNVITLTGSTGTVLQRYVYSPDGIAAVLTSSWSNSSESYGSVYTFQAGRFDSVSGMSHFGHREYSSSIGRWVQQDPAGYVDGSNIYQFENSNPIDNLDPSGLKSVNGGGDASVTFPDQKPGNPAYKATYKDQNQQKCDKCKWHQSVWVDAFIGTDYWNDITATQHVPGRLPSAPQNPNVPQQKEQIISDDPNNPIWYPDDGTDGHAPGEVTAYDGPNIGPGQFGDLKNAWDQYVKGRKGYSLNIVKHYRTFLVCNGVDVYSFEWEASASQNYQGGIGGTHFRENPYLHGRPVQR